MPERARLVAIPRVPQFIIAVMIRQVHKNLSLFAGVAPLFLRVTPSWLPTFSGSADGPETTEPLGRFRSRRISFQTLSMRVPQLLSSQQNPIPFGNRLQEKLHGFPNLVLLLLILVRLSARNRVRHHHLLLGKIRHRDSTAAAVCADSRRQRLLSDGTAKVQRPLPSAVDRGKSTAAEKLPAHILDILRTPISRAIVPRIRFR